MRDRAEKNESELRRPKMVQDAVGKRGFFGGQSGE